MPELEIEEEDNLTVQPDHAMLCDLIETHDQTLMIQIVALSNQVAEAQASLLIVRAQLDKLTPLAEVFENFGKMMDGGGGGLLGKMLAG